MRFRCVIRYYNGEQKACLLFKRTMCFIRVCNHPPCGVHRYMINLFNLLPIGSMDGGRVAETLSPWLPAGGLVLGGPWAQKTFELIGGGAP